jgi:trehalose synthase
MLQHVEVSPRPLTAYERLIPGALVREVRTLAASLRGCRVVHINATPQGGGVAEILHSLVPLLQSVGVDANWYVLPPDDAFFEVTSSTTGCRAPRAGWARATSGPMRDT